MAQINPTPNNGTIEVSGDDSNLVEFENSGTIEINSGGTLTNGTGFDGSYLYNYSTLNNNGTLTNNSELVNLNYSTLTNNGTFTNNNHLLPIFCQFPKSTSSK